MELLWSSITHIGLLITTTQMHSCLMVVWESDTFENANCLEYHYNHDSKWSMSWSIVTTVSKCTITQWLCDQIWRLITMPCIGVQTMQNESCYGQSSQPCQKCTITSWLCNPPSTHCLCPQTMQLSSPHCECVCMLFTDSLTFWD